MKQEIDDEDEIDFELISNGKHRRENITRWKQLKSFASSRKALQMPEILQQLKHFYKHKQRFKQSFPAVLEVKKPKNELIEFYEK